LVEPTKITPSQISNGSQYLRKDFIQRSDVWNQRSARKRRTSNIEHWTSNGRKRLGITVP